MVAQTADFVIALLLLLATIAVALADGVDDKKEDYDQCGLYLALSSKSTDEDIAYGVFTGKDIPKGDPIGYPDVAINMINLRANMYAHTSNFESKEEAKLLDETTGFLEGNIWIPDQAGGRFELADGKAVTAIPGVGVFARFNDKLTNSNWDHLQAYRRSPAMGEEPGVSHPGRGSYSPVYNIGLKAEKDIPAGMEIFVNYGQHWKEEEEVEMTKDDFDKIDEAVDKMEDFFKNHTAALDADAKNAIYEFLLKDVMKAAVGEEKAQVVAELLPADPDDLHQVPDAGGSLTMSHPGVHRSADWLEQNGRCLDNIRPGTSTVPHAGRGAFATRKIKAGGLVSPFPLIQLPDGKEILIMYNITAGEDDTYSFNNDERKVIGDQLLVNYCYSHPDSNLLLFPAGSLTNFINHNEKPNAKIVWSDHPMHQQEWLDLEAGELMEEDNQYHGLMMDIVSTRDIEEGEEIFLDYGPEWVAAWEAHVSAWNGKLEEGTIPNKWPLKAVDLNELYRTKVFKTEAELSSSPYSDTVDLKAFLMLAENGAKGTEKDPKQWDKPVKGTVYDGENLFDIVIISAKKIKDDSLAMPYNYTCRWTNNKGEHTFVENIPHSAFVFVDQPEESDHFVRDPFRHFIGIPDEIFPKAWRDLLDE